MNSVKVKLFSGALSIREVLVAQDEETSGGNQPPGSGSNSESGGNVPPGRITIGNPLQADTISEVLGAIANFLFIISFPIITIMILWGAFQLLTAAGNEERIRQGRRTITWAVIGLVVVLIAGGIATLVANILGGASGGVGGGGGPPARPL